MFKVNDRIISPNGNAGTVVGYMNTVGTVVAIKLDNGRQISALTSLCKPESFETWLIMQLTGREQFMLHVKLARAAYRLMACEDMLSKDVGLEIYTHAIGITNARNGHFCER